VAVAFQSAGTPYQLQCSTTPAPSRFRLLDGPTYGRLEGVNLAHGTFTYVPDTGSHGTDTITFRWVSMNGQFRTNTALVTLHVVPGAAPTCPAQHLDNVPSSGVHLQFSCPDVGGHPGYRIVRVPKHGYLKNVDLAAGTATYFPDPGVRRFRCDDLPGRRRELDLGLSRDHVRRHRLRALTSNRGGDGKTLARPRVVLEGAA
jgi:hypothetical protein